MAAEYVKGAVDDRDEGRRRKRREELEEGEVEKVIPHISVWKGLIEEGEKIEQVLIDAYRMGEEEVGERKEKMKEWEEKENRERIGKEYGWVKVRKHPYPKQKKRKIVEVEEGGGEKEGQREEDQRDEGKMIILPFKEEKRGKQMGKREDWKGEERKGEGKIGEKKDI